MRNKAKSYVETIIKTENTLIINTLKTKTKTYSTANTTKSTHKHDYFFLE